MCNRNTDKQVNCNKILLETIFNNLNNLTKSEIIIYLNKLLSFNEVKEQLLLKLLQNHIFSKVTINSIDDLKNVCNKVLKIYNPKIINTSLEDEEWLIYNNTSTKYELFKDEILFENTIPIVDTHDINMINYLEHICTILRNLSSNVDIKYRVLESRKNKIGIIIIKCSYKSNVCE